MTNEEMLSVAEIVERLVTRFHEQAADHERQLAEHRASFGARTEADAKIIAGLRAERDGLQTQVQDMRAEMERLQMEVAALKSQTPKHPAKVGEWVRKTTDGLMYKTGEARRLVSYEIIKGEIWCNLEDGASWKMSVCEPCDPPTEATHDTPEGRSVVESVIRNDRNTEPRPGDTVRMVRVPTPGPDFDGLIEFPWNTEWGSVGDVAAVVATLAPTDLPVAAVRVSSGIVVWWPLSCVEVVMSEFWVKVESERVVSACDVRKVTT